MALISPILGKCIFFNHLEYYSSRGERPVNHVIENNPLSRQGASTESMRRPDSERAIDTTLTRQVSISDAKDEEISTNIATNHIHRFTTTVKKCESNNHKYSNQQNMLKQNLSNQSVKCRLNLKCHTSKDLVSQFCHVGKKCTRSRHSLFYLDTYLEKQICLSRHRHRDREPSRISAKKLKRKLKLIKKNILLKNNKHNIQHNINSYTHNLKTSVPRSSQLRNIVRSCQNIHNISLTTVRCYPDVTCTMPILIKKSRFRTKLFFMIQALVVIFYMSTKILII